MKPNEPLVEATVYACNRAGDSDDCKIVLPEKSYIKIIRGAKALQMTTLVDIQHQNSKHIWPTK